MVMWMVQTGMFITKRGAAAPRTCLAVVSWTILQETSYTTCSMTKLACTRGAGLFRFELLVIMRHVIVYVPEIP